MRWKLTIYIVLNESVITNHRQPDTGKDTTLHNQGQQHTTCKISFLNHNPQVMTNINNNQNTNSVRLSEALKHLDTSYIWSDSK